jgi:hypothetical protein
MDCWQRNRQVVQAPARARRCWIMRAALVRMIMAAAAPPMMSANSRTTPTAPRKWPIALCQIR